MPPFDDMNNRNLAGSAAADEISFVSYKSKLERLDSQIYEVSWSDIQDHGRTKAGVGGFSRVDSVHVNHPNLNIKKRYALKFLNKRTMQKRKTFVNGARDLAAEGEILSRINHENIIQLHGVSAGGPHPSFVETEQGYFLLLDLLHDTLSAKLTKCRKNSQKGNNKEGGASSSFCSSEKQRIKTVALGIAQGLEYLHSIGIILRDLKPDNIGFDEDGTPKIFDLGFAREVHTLRYGEVAGSLRYMSPEMATARCGGSDLSSDVYSFGVLLWEICTLEKPFVEFESKDDFIMNVVQEDYRPSLELIESPTIQRLIKACWDPNPRARPNMAQVLKALENEISLPFDGDSSLSSIDTQTSNHATILDGMALVDSSFGISNFGYSNFMSSLYRPNSIRKPTGGLLRGRSVPIPSSDERKFKGKDLQQRMYPSIPTQGTFLSMKPPTKRLPRAVSVPQESTSSEEFVEGLPLMHLSIKKPTKSLSRAASSESSSAASSSRRSNKGMIMPLKKPNMHISRARSTESSSMKRKKKEDKGRGVPPTMTTLLHAWHAKTNAPSTRSVPSYVNTIPENQSLGYSGVKPERKIILNRAA